VNRSIECDGREPDGRQADLGDRMPAEPGLDRQDRQCLREQPADRAAVDVAGLRAAIDRAAEGRPTFLEFLERLETAGIRAVPSLQKSGRLNGMSYEVAGKRIKGSDVGRAYTALGLEKQKGIRHDGERDRAGLARAAQEATTRTVERMRPERTKPERAHPDLRDRAERLRLYETLSDGERTTLWDIGRFRTVQRQDLIAIRYQGDRAAWCRDYERLAREKLIEQRSIVVATHATGKGRHRTRAVRSRSVVVLTRKGKELLQRCEPETKLARQALYAGFVKPSEIAHDTAIYRLFQAEGARIAQEGGRITRVALDFELKKRAYSPLARAKKVSDREYSRTQREVARENGLAVVDGKIRFPDLRIEYETARGEPDRVDLELATEHYRGDHMATKAKAGFKICAERASFPGAGDSYGWSPVHDDHHIDVFSF